MKKLFSLIFFLVISLFVAQAAYLENVPRTLVQPNGDTLHCFATGDEFYLRLHDANNYTIIQDPSTGYFVYGIQQRGDIVPSQWIAGQVDPATKGLQPGICISRENYLKRRQAMVLPAKRDLVRDENTNHGTMNNIAVFIRFADDSAFENSFSSVDMMFNDTSNNYQANSMYNYFKRTSYNQLFINTYFFPASDGNNHIISYQDSFPHSYFEPWSVTNPNGYIENDSVHERTPREHELLARACAYVDSMIPADLDIDYNRDGLVDNVCFIIKGNVGDWNVLLWPHRWSLYAAEAYLQGKRVWDYNFQLSDNSSYFNTSVMCHEMFHSLGAPDLYHYHDDTGMDACGKWDLMCSNQNPPQQTCAYMKYKYGNWLTNDQIIPLEEYGTYTIMPLNSETPDRVCYRHRTQSPFEYILMDYRSQTVPFDNTCYSRGVVFYRVNTLYQGNADYNGVDNLDEIYVFRTNGTPTNNGILSAANFRGNIARREFSPLTNPHPFLSNGDFVPMHILNFTSGVDSIQFDVAMWVSVDEYDQETLTAYPNPAQNVLTIKTSQNGPLSLQVFNFQGQLIASEMMTNQTHLLNISNYPAGYYFIKIFDNQKHFRTLKFVKQ